MTFIAKIEQGKLELGSEYNRDRFRAFMQKNEGGRVRIALEAPESDEMRGYFEGAIIPSLCRQIGGYDSKNPADREAMRELLKIEFNGRTVVGLDGTPYRVAQSTKGRRVLREFLNRVTAWMEENGYAVPSPELFKKWRDVYSHDDPADYYEWLEKHGLREDGSTVDSQLRI